MLQNDLNFLKTAIRDDETWVHNFDSLTKPATSLLKRTDFPPPKNIRKIAGKVMMIIFFDRSLSVCCTPKITVKSEHYVSAFKIS